nr:mucin-2-like [Nicotiana tomentosiformis]
MITLPSALNAKQILVTPKPTLNIFFSDNSTIGGSNPITPHRHDEPLPLPTHTTSSHNQVINTTSTSIHTTPSPKENQSLTHQLENALITSAKQCTLELRGTKQKKSGQRCALPTITLSNSPYFPHNGHANTLNPSNSLPPNAIPSDGLKLYHERILKPLPVPPNLQKQPPTTPPIVPPSRNPNPTTTATGGSTTTTTSKTLELRLHRATSHSTDGEHSLPITLCLPRTPLKYEDAVCAPTIVSPRNHSTRTQQSDPGHAGNNIHLTTSGSASTMEYTPITQIMDLITNYGAPARFTRTTEGRISCIALATILTGGATTPENSTTTIRDSMHRTISGKHPRSTSL